MDEHTSVNNAWVESYLDALLTEGLSSEFVRKPGSNEADNVNADSEIFAKYYVSQLLTFGDDALRNAWSKATAVHGHNAQIDARLEYLLWRIWSMNLRQARVKAAQEPAEEPTFIADSGSDEEGAAGGMHGTLPSHSSFSDLNRADAVLTAIHEDVAYDQPASPHSITFENRPHNLYIVLISLHGLVRGQNMELGKDPDTGGQVKYVVELAKNLAQHPMVHRVDLLTRLICDPKVDATYSQPEECLYQGPGQHGGAYIIRLPCGPKEQYIRKEALWPHVREFADYSIDYIREKLQRMSEDGEGSELYVVHGHYADAGEAAAMIGHTLSADMVMTGHSLGRNKLEHLLKSNTMRRAEIEAAYTISRRIEAEERCLDAAMMVFTSTQQEVDSQWGLYDGYNLRLARAMRGPRARHDRHVPEMRVIPPGLDFSSLKVELPADPLALFGDVQTDAIGKSGSLFGSLGSARGLSPLGTPPSTPPSALGAGSSLLSSALGQAPAALPAAAVHEPDAAAPEPDLTPHAVGSLASDMGGIGVAVKQVEEEPRIWKETYKFLRNPYKPVVLAMSRPDAKKNVATLVRAFGSHSVLKNMCNLVLILGNRDHIDSLAPGSKSVLEQVLKLIDAYDLYGSVAYPKKHSQSDISDIYRLAHVTRGVFTNIALQEPFGLTLIEAAAHGVPIVATTHGGPVDIIKTLKCGVLVEPTDVERVGAALLDIVSQPELWEQYSRAGVDNIMAYSWPSHCIRYLHAMEAKKQSREKRRERHFGSWDESTFQAALGAGGEGPGKDATAATAAADKPGELSSIRIARGAGQDSEAAHRGVDRSCSSPVAMAEVPPMSTLVAGVAPESQGLEGLGMGAAGAPPMAQDDVDVLPSGTPSGHPTSLPAAAAVAAGAGGGTAGGGVELLALRQERYVFVTLDTHDTAPLVGLLLQRLRSQAAAGAAIGLGVLSMLELLDTKELLAAEGIDPASLSVLSCSAGAALYYGTSDGQLLADEQYENHLAAAPWNKRFRMATGRGNAQQSSRKILRHVMLTDRYDLSASTGPYHVLLEMDRSQSNTRLGHHALMDRIRKHARTSGLRMSLTLQLVPDADPQLPSSCKLHATPINANRPQALRYALCRLGRPLSAATLLLPVHACLPTAAAADGAADAEEVTPVAGYTNDLESLLGGRGCCVLCPSAPASGSAAAEAAQPAAPPPEEDDAMQFELRPAQYCGRVRAACGGPDPAVSLALGFACSDAAPRS